MCPMEPTPEEMAAMTTLDAIADWADLPHRAEGAAAPASPRGTFFAVLGATGQSRPRNVAAISVDAFADAVKQWRIQDSVPSPVLQASAGLLGTAARLAFGAGRSN